MCIWFLYTWWFSFPSSLVLTHTTKKGSLFPFYISILNWNLCKEFMHNSCTKNSWSHEYMALKFYALLPCNLHITWRNWLKHHQEMSDSLNKKKQIMFITHLLKPTRWCVVEIVHTVQSFFYWSIKFLYIYIYSEDN